MPDDPTKILQDSSDARELSKAAVALARGADPAAHQTLLRHLTASEFLLRLDSAEDYLGYPKRLRLRRVLDELARNPAPAGHKTLAALAGDSTFVGEPARADLLIMACAVVRPAPPEVVAFWDAHCLPDDGFCNLTIEALVQNGSPPAMALLSRKLADRHFEEEDRVNWMRSSILTHRNDAGLLAICEPLLKGTLDETLRVPLVEVLFDYKPAEWYAPATVLEPPPRAALAPDAGEILARIGRHALDRLSPPADLAEKVKLTLETLEESGPRK
jgi:hypothetical protein